MLRLISLLAVAAALAVAFLVPGSASAVVNACLSGGGWNLIPKDLLPGHADRDRNGDGFICHHEAFIGVGSVFIDNNVPNKTAEGLTDDGSTVLVDTATGDILGG